MRKRFSIVLLTVLFLLPILQSNAASENNGFSQLEEMTKHTISFVSGNKSASRINYLKTLLFIDNNESLAVLVDGTVQLCKEIEAINAWPEESWQVGLYDWLMPIKEWNSIVAIDGTASCVVGLRADGTVFAVGNEEDISDITTWTDIIQIASYNNCIIGLKNDGTLCIHGKLFKDIDAWNNIDHISVGSTGIAALRKGGKGYYIHGTYEKGKSKFHDYLNDKTTYKDLVWYYNIIDRFCADGSFSFSLGGNDCIGGISAAGEVALRGKKYLDFSRNGFCIAGILPNGTIEVNTNHYRPEVNRSWEKIAKTTRTWQNIVQIYVCDFCKSIVALGNDGSIKIAGDDPNNYNGLTNVVSFIQDDIVLLSNGTLVSLLSDYKNVDGLKNVAVPSMVTLCLE